MNRVAAIIVILSSVMLAGQNTAGHRLTVRVRNAPEQKGMVRVAIFGSEGDFLRKPVRAQSAQAKAVEAVIVFDGLADGDYAVAAYQDENGNGKLDRNFIGIPKEPNGMSNGAKGKFGPPKWRDAFFKLSADAEKEIVLE